MIAAGKFLQQRYRIDKQIGQGGMGAVYVATDERFGSTVAIKQTLCMDENFRKAIEREARLLNSLKHTALPRVTDHFVEDDGQFLVMEFIPGEDLGFILDRDRKAFAVSDVLTWVDQLLDALEFLHSQDVPVVHRDIKPQNLKLTAKGQIVLLDFGLAKGNPTDAGHQTAAKSIFGYSRNYASLEQIQGTGTDPRSDIYSLAATAYHLMTGEPPEDALTRAMNVLGGQPDPLVAASSMNPAVARGVAGVLNKALDLNAAGRPSSAREMREMLAESESYAQFALGSSAPVTITDPELAVQQTRLMPESTQAESARQTDLKTEIMPSNLSQVTAVRPSAAAIGATAPGSGFASRRPKLVPALAACLLLFGAAVAGGIYKFKPSVFGMAPDTDVKTTSFEPPAPANVTAPEPVNETALQQQSAANRSNSGSSAEKPKAAQTTERPAETAKGTKPVTPKTEADGPDVPDVQIGDPQHPNDVVVTERKNGVTKTTRVGPDGVVINKNIPPGMMPLPNGRDFKTMTPQQRQELRRLMREKLTPPNAPQRPEN